MLIPNINMLILGPAEGRHAGQIVVLARPTGESGGIPQRIRIE
jgi:hypothetical protein